MTDFYPARLPDREQRARLGVLRDEAQRAWVAGCVAEDRGDLAAACLAHTRAQLADAAMVDIYEAAQANGPQVDA